MKGAARSFGALSLPFTGGTDASAATSYRRMVGE